MPKLILIIAGVIVVIVAGAFILLKPSPAPLPAEIPELPPPSSIPSEILGDKSEVVTTVDLREGMMTAIPGTTITVKVLEVRDLTSQGCLGGATGCQDEARLQISQDKASQIVNLRVIHTASQKEEGVNRATVFGYLIELVKLKGKEVTLRVGLKLAVAPPPPSPTPTPPPICPQVQIPVCGTDGKTYNNPCYAIQAGVNVQHGGACTGKEPPPIPSPTPTLPPPSTSGKEKIMWVSTRDAPSGVTGQELQSEVYYEIYTIDPDGTGIKRLTNNSIPDKDARWTSDGKITFVRVQLNQAHIWMMDADGANVKQLTTARPGYSQASLSPDGKKFVFVRATSLFNSDIYVMDADGANEKNLTNSPNVGDAEPEWTHDGKILFQSQRDGDPAFELYFMDADGTNIKRITNEPMVGNADGKISSDGNKIVFTRSDPKAQEEAIYVVNSDGTNMKKVIDVKTDADGGNSLEGDPGISPDGKRVAYVSTRGGQKTLDDLYVVNIDGTGEYLLTTSRGIDRDPEWTQLP